MVTPSTKTENQDPAGSEIYKTCEQPKKKKKSAKNKKSATVAKPKTQKNKVSHDKYMSKTDLVLMHK